MNTGSQNHLLAGCFTLAVFLLAKKITFSSITSRSVLETKSYLFLIFFFSVKQNKANTILKTFLKVFLIWKAKYSFVMFILWKYINVFFAVLRTEPRVFCMLDKHSATELHSQSDDNINFTGNFSKCCNLQILVFFLTCLF